MTLEIGPMLFLRKTSFYEVFFFHLQFLLLKSIHQNILIFRKLIFIRMWWQLLLMFYLCFRSTKERKQCSKVTLDKFLCYCNYFYCHLPISCASKNCKFYLFVYYHLKTKMVFDCTIHIIFCIWTQRTDIAGFWKFFFMGSWVKISGIKKWFARYAENNGKG